MTYGRRPEQLREGHDGLDRSRAREGEILRFENTHTFSSPPFRGCAGILTPPIYIRSAPPRQLGRAIARSWQVVSCYIIQMDPAMHALLKELGPNMSYIVRGPQRWDYGAENLSLSLNF